MNAWQENGTRVESLAMLVIRGNDTLPESARGGVLAIGNFDGVHRGHQALINEARSVAGRLGAVAGAIVFEPHPREYFSPDEPHFRLTPIPEKLRLFELYGLDITVVLEFCGALSGLSAQVFITDILVERLGVTHVVVGYDFLFGKGRSGNVETLKAAGRELGFGVTVIGAQSPQSVGDGGGVAGDEVVFSSSSIRADLARGDVAVAARAMGHWWRVSGTVEGGAKIGTQIGFPTANIALPAGTDLAHGVYAVRASVGDERFDGAAYFGSRPTVDGGAPMLEVTIFDFDGDLYGQEIAVSFVGFVRPDMTLSSLDALTNQIEKDCAQVRQILGKAGEQA